MCTGTATASIYTVGTGSGYNYTTINAAVYNASPGDTILVSDGTYTENINISKPLTVISENGLATTVINSSSGNDVFYIDNTSHVTISGFNITGAGDGMAGIYLASVYSCNISGNLIYNNYFGIYLENSTDNILTGNIINSSGWDGISLYSSSENNTMIDNIISYTGCDGIYLDYSGNNTLTNNTIIDNPESGIDIYNSINNNINSNTITNNSLCGIFLDFSGNSTLTGNLMSLNDYNFRVNGSELANFLNDIDLTNLVNGEPLYYWIDHSDEQVPSDAGLVCVINSTNITVRDIELTQGYAGVLFAYTDNSIIYNVTASENYYGVHLFSSSFNTIDNITANNNTQQGICITSSSNDISIANNIIRSNGVLGMSISYSDNSTLVNNTLSSNFSLGL
ncbi:right-handed parallel beta-helix repeat-containing protein [Methanolobus psychrotolerans]|uniref:right-handed parallel beta-helix repeat-containing protein n=1 Tax=Methanolobus psychrotolerans TaxID=1874706 RepID=UPI0013EAEA5B|nr:NosD domain-containing protein [Methanolobus psychrotolerans]